MITAPHIVALDAAMFIMLLALILVTFVTVFFATIRAFIELFREKE